VDGIWINHRRTGSHFYAVSMINFPAGKAKTSGQRMRDLHENSDKSPACPSPLAALTDMRDRSMAGFEVCLSRMQKSSEAKKMWSLCGCCRYNRHGSCCGHCRRRTRARRRLFWPGGMAVPNGQGGAGCLAGPWIDVSRLAGCTEAHWEHSTEILQGLLKNSFRTETPCEPDKS
jgi:hypothetical protein